MMQCEEMGGKYREVRDRHFILMDGDTGKLVTGRQFPKLLTISANIHGGILFLASGGRTFELNIAEVVRRQDKRFAELHENLKQEGLDCGNQITEFLRLILKTSNNIRVLYFTKNLLTEPEQSYDSSAIEHHDPVAFPDDCPYLTLCQSSLADLNSRLPTGDHVDMRYFRPVIQIAGPPAYDEDKWSELKIDNVTFICDKPCSRCVLITIDPDTGLHRQNEQPLRLLREYRMATGKLREKYSQYPLFGILMKVKKQGTIRVGDSVYARYK
ncbi:unnamed protein product [Enterobius vermicularis]|uniref:MOSC domain-containing protein n=1 Tax=Enterobius vermicularis TaxID=51028 RepID=A0A0N4V858_ENTVE|nr:unnamed protein product [Enterobius vermicularis]